jgi:hypothetical protein
MGNGCSEPEAAQIGGKKGAEVQGPNPECVETSLVLATNLIPHPV